MGTRLKDMWPGEVYDMMIGRRNIAYRIYPSLLDKYQSLLEYEIEAEQPWNKWSEKKVAEYHAARRSMDFPPAETHAPEVGDYILTPEEMYDKIEQELIDSINREPHEPSEAADRGTALNEVIDCLILNKGCSRDDMSIESLRVNGDAFAIRAVYDGFTFDFDISLCRELRRMLNGSVCQYCISAPIDTKYGSVLLYGYMDYWHADRIIDLKTTSQYNFGKYEHKWQRHAYPYCAIESGLTDSVSDFTYLCAQLGKGSVIGGKIYPETYSYNHEQSKKMLTEHIEGFLGWLESPNIKDKITDKKIFNDLTL